MGQITQVPQQGERFGNLNLQTDMELAAGFLDNHQNTITKRGIMEKLLIEKERVMAELRQRGVDTIWHKQVEKRAGTYTPAEIIKISKKEEE